MSQAINASASPAPRVDSSEIPWNPKVHQRRTFSDWVVDIAIWVILTLVVFVVLYPLWFIVIASFSDQTYVAQGQVLLWPKGFNLNGYEMVFADGRIWQGYWNTIVYSVVGTALNIAVTIPAAFALSRREFKPRRILMFLFTFTMFFAGGMIPNYLLYKELNLLNSMWVFILPTAVNVFNLIVARSFFESSIPNELFEAAQLDGESYYGFFFKIVIPLSAAIMAVIMLYYFVQHWNDFATGLIYVNKADKQPLQNVLRDILLANTSQTGSAMMNAAQQQLFADQIKYGIILVSTLPLLILYPFLQKYFNKGVMIGAVKG
ncbi:carbohydrate ABC transporter permease [Bifidobacterium vespertilionis]|uniref:Carbohydrate ABC transporter permease n=1 Tax=Bifidobacterium vespertilionis TaxID=2562524 RepID=A0A5J5DUY9_9BIFI|nr:carbohydrate ABC transporter permease [Bifidobacterium vespertilionis]KAA8820216.1 carbohydrate ABC transporter permease [Bifidobacterium vespertilionis]KAA8823859.1 carbohydrate ABC transporter permease [Bifidobacterium vespertilionis]MBT1179083.1 carbohydrate ABC transporter permease [Bifidobacterium vespertilionis]